MSHLIKCLILASVLAACKSHVNLSESIQRQIQDQLVGKSLWLKQSLYVGDFYDDDRYCFMHPRPFEELTYLTTLDGDIMLPPSTKEIVPVGTRVTAKKIDWPTAWNITKRPIFTPKFWPWIFFDVARDRGNVSINRDKTCIMLLPDDGKAWIDDTFSTNDTNVWLLSNDEAVREGILQKRPVVGMSYEALHAAMGQPDQIRKEWVQRDGEKITKEIALYGPIIVILENGKVVSVQ